MDNLPHESVMFRYIVGLGWGEGVGLRRFLEAVMFRYLFLRVNAMVCEGNGVLDLY